MKQMIVNYAYIAAFAALCCAGCDRSAPHALAPMPVAQISPALLRTFAGADKETQDQASQYVAAIQNNDWPAAFEHLGQLRSNPNLTQEQRATLSRIQQTTVRQLNDSAAKGDEKAADTMAVYKAGK